MKGNGINKKCKERLNEAENKFEEIQQNTAERRKLKI